VNDSAHVEQKRHVYALARLHVNFLQPVQKRVTKTRLPEVFSWRLRDDGFGNPEL